MSEDNRTPFQKLEQRIYEGFLIGATEHMIREQLKEEGINADQINLAIKRTLRSPMLAKMGVPGATRD